MDYKINRVVALFSLCLSFTQANAEVYIGIYESAYATGVNDDCSIYDEQDGDIKEITQPPFVLESETSVTTNAATAFSKVITDLTTATISGVYSYTLIPHGLPCDVRVTTSSILEGVLADNLTFTYNGTNSSEVKVIPFQVITTFNENQTSSDVDLSAKRVFSIGDYVDDTVFGYDDPKDIPLSGSVSFSGSSANIPVFFAYKLIPYLRWSSITPTSGDFSHRLILGPLPDGVSCSSESGIFPGCDAPPLSLSDVKITQAVFDTDGINDLVLNRETAIFATVQSNIGSGLATLRACAADALGLCDKNRILSSTVIDLSLFSQAKEVMLPHFTSASPTFFNQGQDKIIVEIDPSNILTPESADKKQELIVNFTETKLLKIPYIVLEPPTTAPYSPITQQDYDTYIQEANRNIMDMFPLANNGLQTPTTPLNKKLTGTLKCILVDEWCEKFNYGFYWDLMYIEETLKKSGKKYVGIVPQEYMDYHFNAPRSGFKTTNNASIVSVNYPIATVHELGHQFGLPVSGGEEYVADSNGNVSVNGIVVNDGFRFSNNSRIKEEDSDIIGFMGRTGLLDGVKGHFVTPEDWKHLIGQLSMSKPDPELIVISSIIGKNGNHQLGSWSVFNGIPDFIESGDYHILMKDENGKIVSDIPFSLGYQLHLEENEVIDTDIDYIAHAVPYPLAVASVSIIAPDGQVIVEVDPIIKILTDSINTIPEYCFIDNPVQQRQDLISSIEKISQLIQNHDESGAESIIENEMIFAINNGLVDDCTHLIETETVKQNLLETIDSTLLHIDGRLALADQDGDGILNDKDICPDSDLSNTVVIGNCNSDVINTLFDNGCSISDDLFSCDGMNNNHGQYVSCVSGITNRLKRDNIITNNDKGKIQSCAAQATIQ